MRSNSPSQRLLELGERWKRSGRWTEARTLYEAAREAAGATGETRVHRRATGKLYVIAWLDGALDEAAELLASAHAATAPRRVAVEAFLAYERGDLDSADKQLNALLADPNASAIHALATGYRAHVRRALGDWAGAVQGYEAAMAALGADDMMAATFAMDAAITALLAGDPAEALNRLARARALSDTSGGGAILERLLHHYEMLALHQLDEHAVVRRRLEEGDAEDAPLALAFLQDVRRALVKPVDRDDLIERAPTFEHARISLHLLQRAQPPSRLRPAIRVHLSTLQVDAGPQRLELEKRPTLWRVLIRLLEAREAYPGMAVPDASLVAAGWPGERMLARAAKNRLHVAIASLRKMGLRSLLLRRGGYFLDPRAPLIWVDGKARQSSSA